MKTLVTGATGYIGTHLVEMALKDGHQLILASRRPAKIREAEWIAYDLKSESPLHLSEPVDAVIHMAANTSGQGSDLTGNDEIRAARLLLSLAKEHDARLIFISSQASSSTAPTEYGRTKWEIEQIVLEAGQFVVRPGQVYGGKPAGLFKELLKTVKQLPLLPAFLPAPKVQPVHVEDLSRGILKILTLDQNAEKKFHIAEDRPVRFSRFLATIATERLHLKRLFVPVPVFLVTGSISMLGKYSQAVAGLKRLISLFELSPMGTSTSLKQLDLRLRSLESGMHRSGSHTRRLILLEGRPLFRYLLGESPSPALLRRYVRMIEQLRGGSPLLLRPYLQRFPSLIALYDESTARNKPAYQEFFWRIDVATIMAEATPRGAVRFLAVDKWNSFFLNLWWICISVASEIFWKVPGLLLMLIPHNECLCFKKERA